LLESVEEGAVVAVALWPGVVWAAPVPAIAASRSAAVADRAGVIATRVLPRRARRMKEDQWNMEGPRREKKGVAGQRAE
jgi:hypothetical protein